MTISELLAASRAAHQDYRAHAGRVAGDGAILTLGDRSLARSAVQTASDLRQQAHDADPTHADLAWLNDTAPHDELAAFYRRYLSTRA